jgi:hypothetical protein
MDKLEDHFLTMVSQKPHFVIASEAIHKSLLAIFHKLSNLFGNTAHTATVLISQHGDLSFATLPCQSRNTAVFKLQHRRVDKQTPPCCEIKTAVLQCTHFFMVIEVQ